MKGRKTNVRQMLGRKGRVFILSILICTFVFQISFSETVASPSRRLCHTMPTLMTVSLLLCIQLRSSSCDRLMFNAFCALVLTVGAVSLCYCVKSSCILDLESHAGANLWGASYNIVYYGLLLETCRTPVVLKPHFWGDDAGRPPQPRF